MGRTPPPAPPPPAWWDTPTDIAGLSAGEAAVGLCAIAILVWVRGHGRQSLHKALAAKGVRTLNMTALTQAASFKEVFLAYLNAAILEPLLSIASDDGEDRKHLLVDGMQLLGLVFWTYMLTDAFDTADTAASFVYRYKVAKDDDRAKLTFLKSKKRGKAAERRGLAGSWVRDVRGRRRSNRRVRHPVTPLNHSSRPLVRYRWRCGLASSGSSWRLPASCAPHHARPRAARHGGPPCATPLVGR